MLRDSLNRPITYLRVSVTDRCNFRCIYCVPAEGVALKPQMEILSFEQIAEVAKVAARLGFSKIRLTGGEPLVRKGIEHLVSMISDIGGYSEICMTTNGSLLTPALAQDLKSAGLNRINISLDTLDTARFNALTRGGDVNKVCAGIGAALAAGLSPVKINMVLFDDTTPAEIDSMERFCNGRGLILQTIRRFSLHDRTFSEGCGFESGRPPRCESCSRLRLTADGKFKSCLFSDDEVPVNFNDIESGIREAVAGKPARGSACESRIMSQIGG
jgi:GTP 3',8-cyclase